MEEYLFMLSLCLCFFEVEDSKGELFERFLN